MPPTHKDDPVPETVSDCLLAAVLQELREMKVLLERQGRIINVKEPAKQSR